MEENSTSTILEGEIIGIKFGLATRQEISTASISGCPISHASQLANPFLGLPLEFGKCESCGTAEPGKCEGHFGYIELPIPIYHPSHVNELKRMLSLLCLKCLKMRKSKSQSKNNGIAERLLGSCCEEASQVSIKDVKTTDGACYLELKLPSRSNTQDGWQFLERYGFRYGHSHTRALLPCEVMEILKKMPEETRKKLASKGYFPQEGYILQYLPVPPNCLSVPDISDGVSVMSSDLSISVLKKVLKQVEVIKSSRSGTPNFESHQVEANDLQSSVDQYLQVRGTAKSSRDVDSKFGISKESNDSSTKAWLEKMRTLFIRKGSGFSSRSVITGDAYKRVNEIGIPFEIAQRMTFEERVNMHNMKYLQDLVDNKLCLTYSDGSSTYSLREGSKGHTFLRPGQVVHRRIMDGDIVFINRPPTTHKHSLQALSVYVHDDHTVKINPLICGPLSADFDGDCVHLFYPQSLAAKAEVVELFSVEKQLMSSHTGQLNLQLTSDSLLSLKMMLKIQFLKRVAAQQLAMFASSSLPQPALLKALRSGPCWTALQILQTALPAQFDCYGDRYLIRKSDILEIDFEGEAIQSMVNEIVTSIFFEKGPEEVLKFFDSLQSLLMESIFAEGFSVGLEDFSVSRVTMQEIQRNIREISPLLCRLRSEHDEMVELQLDNAIRKAKVPISNFILQSSALGDLIDSKSDSAISKVVQQIGLLGLQISDRGKFYSKTLVEDVASLFRSKYPSGVEYASAEHGLIKSCFFLGLDPYEEMVHSISTREVIVRSSRGLSEPGTLFKNLMAILRDVVICYDGTVRNVSSNSIIQFEYGVMAGTKSQSLYPPGEPVGVLAATAMSNPAYKAVLDSSPSSNSSWDLMKEILLCRANFRNDLVDRRVILYLNDCACGRKHCRENAAILVKDQLKKVRLKDTVFDFSIEYKKDRTASEGFESDAGLVGHVHLKKELLNKFNISMQEVLQKCQETINSYPKKKKDAPLFKHTILSASECCCFSADELSDMPCLMFYWKNASDIHMERTIHVLANMICPVLLETIIKGDTRISMANITWINPDTTSWIRNSRKFQKGEIALDIVLEKSVVKQSGDAWRIVLDACLPVLHLIDTRRSIPYGIKQVQELLGVASGFDQAIQRLSTSVTMVAKGVTKEHLILLANSMTCTGNLVGFNSAGIKALYQSLNVQVPFTEATLFTPRKCFEKAAEKCHVDSLSNIVASCSWGKHVAVGTGSRFDVLWDKKEMGSNVEGGIDVYNFLHMVRSVSNGGESDVACLGFEIDDSILEEEYADWSLSPEHNIGSDRPVFEDSAEYTLDNQVMEVSKGGESCWEKVSHGSDDGGEWGVKKSGDVGTSSSKSDWSSWGSKDKTQAQNHDASTDKGMGCSNSNGWAAQESEKGVSTSAWGMQKEPLETNWGKQKESLETGWGKPKDPQESSWGKEKQPQESNWGKPKAPQETGWGKPKELQESTWGNQKQNQETTWGKEKEPQGSTWGKEKQPQESTWGKETQPQESTWGKQKENQDSTWGKQKENQESTWGKQKETQKSTWGNQKEALENTWGKQKESQESSWGKQKEPQESSWGKQKEPQESTWGKQKEPQESSWGKQKEPQESTWGKQKEPQESSWGKQKEPQESTWGKQKEPQESTWGKQKEPQESTWGKEKDLQDTSWDKPKESEESSHGWGAPYESNQPTTARGWDSSKSGRGGGEKQNQWGRQNRDTMKKNRFEGGGRGSNTGDWKDRNRLAKSPGMANNDAVGGIFTATRQRLDMFTSEEQDILLDIEPIMQSLRRIMHQSGYNDGDPLSAEDQSYIQENVFNYHPDKAVKAGAGIDHFMVSRHSSFLESRCLYVVDTTGRKEDFSYRKCLDNFVRTKYPSLAEEFLGKYFRPRTRVNQERAPGTDGRNREANVGGGRSRGKQDQTQQGGDGSMGKQEQTHQGADGSWGKQEQTSQGGGGGGDGSWGKQEQTRQGGGGSWDKQEPAQQGDGDGGWGKQEPAQQGGDGWGKEPAKGDGSWGGAQGGD